MSTSVGDKLDRDLTFRERLIIRIAGTAEWGSRAHGDSAFGAEDVLARADAIIRAIDEESVSPPKPPIERPCSDLL